MQRTLLYRDAQSHPCDHVPRKGFELGTVLKTIKDGMPDRSILVVWTSYGRKRSENVPPTRLTRLEWANPCVIQMSIATEESYLTSDQN